MKQMVSLQKYCLNYITGKNSKYHMSVIDCCVTNHSKIQWINNHFLTNLWVINLGWIQLDSYSINFAWGYSCYFIHLVAKLTQNDLESPHSLLGVGRLMARLSQFSTIWPFQQASSCSYTWWVSRFTQQNSVQKQLSTFHLHHIC